MRLTLGLLVVWAIAGLGCGVLLADVLNEFTFLGFPLGFWFAQQGAIIMFVVLILIYALAMGRFDRKLKAQLRQIADEENAS
ncbi:MAG: putative solute:sodium symporter small subunit [Planctomycetota bacterium]|jgi:putative solute:sodium symporter small subunit